MTKLMLRVRLDSVLKVLFLGSLIAVRLGQLEMSKILPIRHYESFPLFEVCFV